MLKNYQQKLIELFTFNQLHTDKPLTDGDKLKLYTDHLATLTEIELEENIRVVSKAIDSALGIDYAKKNPSLIAALIPHVQMDVRDYVQRFAQQFNIILKDIKCPDPRFDITHPDYKYTDRPAPLPPSSNGTYRKTPY